MLSNNDHSGLLPNTHGMLSNNNTRSYKLRLHALDNQYFYPSLSDVRGMCHARIDRSFHMRISTPKPGIHSASNRQDTPGIEGD